MTRSRLLPLLVALAALGACAQGPTLDQRLSTFVGRGEADLVAALGVPVRTYEAEGRRFLQFEQRRNLLVASPLAAPYGPWGPRYGYWAPPPSYVQASCDLTFALRDQRVESFSYRGEACG
ncbi:hypothetical protein [Falsiroseomonas tokyonensis]|uniref:Lipoprotein n=1 Tax=Falsiroseomonas tokyonensis TaxID=430521 RepID=A0ABV7BQE7_9PROT|nr:hypothetical protein [Falsiroseomonas tokyonensis]MBU8536324.1 hypothetical protein [Falsiroseomonas tokyonensis]